MKVKRQCAVCRIPFIVDDARRITCSVVCHKKYTSDYEKACWDDPDNKLIAKAYGNTFEDLELKKVKRKCTVCGTEFTAYNTKKHTCHGIYNKSQTDQKKIVREINDMKELLGMTKNLFENSSRSDIIRKKEQKECRERDKAIAKAKRDTPKNKAKRQALRDDPINKAKRKEYDDKPENKKKKKKYRQRPDIKVKIKARNNKPENREKLRKYSEQYNRDPKNMAKAKVRHDSPEYKARAKSRREKYSKKITSKIQGTEKISEVKL